MHKHRERMIKRGPSVLLRLRTHRAVAGPAKTGDNHHRKAFVMEKGFSKGEKGSLINLSLDPTILTATTAGAHRACIALASPAVRQCTI